MSWMASGTLPEIIVCEHSSLCNGQSQVKTQSCKVEAIFEHDPETAVQSLLEMDSGKVENFPMVRKTKFEFLFETFKLRRRRIFQLSVLSFDACMHQGQCNWKLAHLECTFKAERYVQVLKQHVLPSTAFISGKSGSNNILHLSQEPGFVFKKLRFWTVLPAVQSLHQQKIFDAS